MTDDTLAAQAYRMAAAIMKMARQQLLLESQLETQSNHYGGVYGGLYRWYGINSYKPLPRNKFNDAMK